MTRSTLLVSLLANDESKTLVIPFFLTGTVDESEHVENDFPLESFGGIFVQGSMSDFSGCKFIV